MFSVLFVLVTAVADWDLTLLYLKATNLIHQMKPVIMCTKLNVPKQ